ncbi:hypothetical protein KEM09_19785 [Carboxylicivirga mesophila]|uniref:Uncharacterized protein n=1 Tax=Carboxylicivirga mesophila TaxID=1166478 RepID=A0ABS5KF31_9BACT|nr:hypothetical protein [Carboxylicivirga mesophila]MBS2213660.1 hypothetical protein [Carboxylicivirga mesophila]
MKRFQDKNLTLSSFEDDVLVVCPKCSKRAIVFRTEPGYYSKRSIKCPNCMYSQIGRTECYQVDLKCYCSNCASEISIQIPNVNAPKDKIAVKCDTCGETQSYTPRNIRLELIYEYNGHPTEPYFQLPLWLVESVKGHSLWAYNYNHLSYLKDYVSADLREKNGRQYWTMVEKLPDWIKSAKNREAVMKGIEKLEKK